VSCKDWRCPRRRRADSPCGIFSHIKPPAIHLKFLHLKDEPPASAVRTAWLPLHLPILVVLASQSQILLAVPAGPLLHSRWLASGRRREALYPSAVQDSGTTNTQFCNWWLFIKCKLGGLGVFIFFSYIYNLNKGNRTFAFQQRHALSVRQMSGIYLLYLRSDFRSNF
jgi:hypothetical protein